ncbi:MAG: hypothetical protein ACE5J7_01070 [Candidatus Aenigmatarchaeota archaeon]
MAEWITFVKGENVRKAEGILKKDFDVAAKQSITVRDAKALGIEAEGSFFYIKGSNEGVARCKELIKDLVAEIEQEKLDKAKEEIEKESEAAASGMGGIFK